MARVLIVDDEPLIRDELRQALESAGLTVDVASNGREAMQMVSAARPDLVLTDILMPEKDGIETIREILSLDRRPKLVAISGGGPGLYKQYVSWAQRLGADRAFEKPVDIAELLYAVVDLLNERTAVSE